MPQAVMDKARRVALAATVLLASMAGVAVFHPPTALAFNNPDNWTCTLASGQWCAQDEPQHAWTYGASWWQYGLNHGIALSQDCAEGFNQYGQYDGGRCQGGTSIIGVGLPGGYTTVWIGESGYTTGMNGQASG